MERFEFGDRVRHARRPEWGVGTVTRVEEIVGPPGTSGQRVHVRFPNEGVKTLNTTVAELEKVPAGSSLPGDVPPEAPPGEKDPLAHWAERTEGDWLSSVAKKKVEEVMVALPERVRDPFASVRKRLQETIHLYRFERSGRSLVEWAIAQTGLDDPLSRFNRHELERYYDRWLIELDQHLSRTLAEVRSTRAAVDDVLRAAPPSFQRALQRINAAV